MIGRAVSPGRLPIEVWADPVCPWCYVGIHWLKKAIDDSPHSKDIDLTVRSYQLEPGAPKESVDNIALGAGKYGISRARMEDMEREMQARAAREGLPYSINRPYASTMDMHRLMYLAAEYDLRNELLDAFSYAFFRDETDTFLDPVLKEIADEVGVPADRVDEVLESREYEAAVLADRRAGVEDGITGVPFTIVGGCISLPGAASFGEYADSIQRVGDHMRGAA